MRVGAVLDDDERVLVGQGEKRPRVDGKPVEMDDEEAAGAR